MDVSSILTQRVQQFYKSTVSNLVQKFYLLSVYGSRVKKVTIRGLIFKCIPIKTEFDPNRRSNIIQNLLSPLIGEPVVNQNNYMALMITKIRFSDALFQNPPLCSRTIFILFIMYISLVYAHDKIYWQWEHICTLGYNDFDFFGEMEPPRPEIDVKWDSQTHFFSRFARFWQKVRMQKKDHKTQNLMSSPPKKSCRPKTLVHCKKVKKFHFSVAFSLINFLHEFFCIFFNGFQSV